MIKRNTVISTAIINVLESATHPLSAAQILVALKNQKLEPNKSTVYRVLAKLVDDDRLTELSVKPGTTFYETLNKRSHAHFLCQECDTVFCLKEHDQLLDNKGLNSALSRQGFHVQSQDLTVQGICEPCQEGASS